MYVVVCVLGRIAKDATAVAPGVDTAFDLLDMTNMSSCSLFLAKQFEEQSLPANTGRVDHLPPPPPPQQL